MQAIKKRQQKICNTENDNNNKKNHRTSHENSHTVYLDFAPWREFYLSLDAIQITNCPQIMVCSCTMASNCVKLQIIFCLCVNETSLFFFLRSLGVKMRLPHFPKMFIEKKKLRDRMIKQFRTRFYRKISWSVRRLREIIDLLATDKSRYFDNLVQ